MTMRTKVEIAIGAVLAAAIAMSEARVSAATMAVDTPASGGASLADEIAKALGR